MFCISDILSLPCFVNWILELPFSNPNNISIDSRKLKNDDLFIPIIGEKFNGHDFLEDAIKVVKVCCVSQDISSDLLEKAKFYGCAIFKVKDTTCCLQELASLHRKKFSNLKVIAITGSCGKTSTKEIIATALDNGNNNVLKTLGNTNNHIGVPLNLLRLNSNHQFAVLELGTNSFGEIKQLTSLVDPDIAILTNIGGAHLEAFKDRDGVALEKSAIFSYSKNDCIAILPNLEKSRSCINTALSNKRIKTFGDSKSQGNWQGRVKYSSLDYDEIEVNSDSKSYSWSWSLKGEHHAINASILFALLETIDYSIEENNVIERLSKIKPPNMRGSTIVINFVTWINDTYNANADSTIASLKSLAANCTNYGGKIIIVLGDILELGEASYSEHMQVVDFLKCNQFWDIVVTVGKNYKLTNFGKNFDNSVSASKYINSLVQAKDCVLLKGSRGMQMEKIIPGDN